MDGVECRPAAGDPPMTPYQILLIRQSFARLELKGERLGVALYEHLFRLDPSLRPLFKGDIKAHAVRLMAALSMVIDGLDDLRPLLAELRALGLRHASDGLTPKHYAQVEIALMRALGDTLGTSLGSEAMAAWAQAYRILADVMMMAVQQHQAA
jgi:hemoglobin-like flavoprotein